MFQNGGAHSYSMREAVELEMNEGLELEDFSDGGSEENVVDSGKEFVLVNLETDLSDSDNDIFIFTTGIQATNRMKLPSFFVWMLCLDSCSAVVTEKGMWYDSMDYLSDKYMTLWIIYPTSTHPKLSKNVYVYCIIPGSLYTFFKKRGKDCIYRSRRHHFVVSQMSYIIPVLLLN